MRARSFCATATVVFLLMHLQRSATADGLIFKLPPDGTWVEFTGEGTATIELMNPEILSSIDERGRQMFAEMTGEMKMQQVIRVSSVGTETYADRPCRWIELSGQATMNGQKTNDQATVLKLLIAERQLQRGQDPLNNAIFTFWNPKGADLAGNAETKGFDRIRYETERMYPTFAPPLRDEKKLPVETIRTSAGDFFDCEVITGTSAFDRPLAAGGRWDGEFTWTIALHADAPFGVVRVAVETSGHEISRMISMKFKQSNVLTLSKTGIDAKSTLPDANSPSPPRGAER